MPRGSLKKGENPREVREGHEERGHEVFWYSREDIAAACRVTETELRRVEKSGGIKVRSLLSICRYSYNRGGGGRATKTVAEGPFAYTRKELSKLFGMKEATLRKNEEREKVDVRSLSSICAFWEERMFSGRAQGEE